MIKRNENIVARKIHGVFFLIDTKQSYMNDKCSLYEINELGFFVWNALLETENVYEIANMIKKEVEDDINIELIVNDVSGFLDMLRREGYVVEDGRD